MPPQGIVIRKQTVQDQQTVEADRRHEPVDVRNEGAVRAVRAVDGARTDRDRQAPRALLKKRPRRKLSGGGALLRRRQWRLPAHTLARDRAGEVQEAPKA